MISTNNDKYIIDFSLLKDKDKNELMLFYQFLLYKEQNFSNKKEDISTKGLPKTFYTPIEINTLEKFNRNEIYSNK